MRRTGIFQIWDGEIYVSYGDLKPHYVYGSNHVPMSSVSDLQNLQWFIDSEGYLDGYGIWDWLIPYTELAALLLQPHDHVAKYLGDAECDNTQTTK